MIPFSELALPAAAFAAVAAAVIVAIAHAGFLGRHVYEQLQLDILERTRANGWDDVPTSAPADPVPLPDSLIAATGYDDNALETAIAEVQAAAAAELADVRREAEQVLAARLQQERSEAQLRLNAAVTETQTASAAELARVRQEADRTLAAKVEEARRQVTAAQTDHANQAESVEVAAARKEADAKAVAAAELARVKQEAAQTLAQALEQARAEAAAELARVKQEAARTLAVKLQEAGSEITAAAEIRIADVRKEAAAVAPPTPTADVVPVVQTSTPIRKQTLEEHIQEARAKLAREKQDALG